MWFNLFGNEIDSRFAVIQASQLVVVKQCLLMPMTLKLQLLPTLINLHVNTLSKVIPGTLPGTSTLFQAKYAEDFGCVVGVPLTGSQRPS